MDNSQDSQATPRSTTSLSATAKAITRFLLNGIQLPPSLSHYAIFFTGLATGAASTALYTYLTRSRSDRAKIQLVVYHIIRLFQQRPDYEALLHHPHELLVRMEPEVMRMVDRHLTLIEAGQVIEALKREYEEGAGEVGARKRVKGGVGGVAGHLRSPRGFLSELDAGQRVVGYERMEEPTTAFVDTQDGCSDAPTDDDGWDYFTSDRQPLRFENEQGNDMMDVDSSSPLPLDLAETPCPPCRRSTAPSPESNTTSTGSTATSTPATNKDDYASESDSDDGEDLHNTATSVVKASTLSVKTQSITSPTTPHKEGFGLDYFNKDLYASDSSSSDEEEDPPSPPPTPVEYTPPSWIKQAMTKAQDDPSKGRWIDTSRAKKPQSTLPPHPPTVIRRLRGVMASGTSLSPILEGGSTQSSCSPLPGDEQVSSEEQGGVVLSANQLPFASWSTTPEMTYSSDEDEATDEVSALSVEATLSPSTPSVPTVQAVFSESAEEDEVCYLDDEAGGTQNTIEVSVTTSNLTPQQTSGPPTRPQSPSPPSKKRKSPSPDHTQATSSPPKRIRTSPLRDITACISNSPSASEQHLPKQPPPPPPLYTHAPIPPRTPPVSPVHNTPPTKRSRSRSHRQSRGRGRGRGCSYSTTSSAAGLPQTPPPPKARAKKGKANERAVSKPSGTRKTPRKTAYGGTYPK